MGRRSRARQRAATAVAARSEPATPATPPRDRGRRGWLRLLNPFRFRRLTSSRARAGAVGFGLSAVLFAVLGWTTGQAAWFSSAVLLAVLALAWGATAALMGRIDRSS
jgi:hypothetical protein